MKIPCSEEERENEMNSVREKAKKEMMMIDDQRMMVTAVGVCQEVQVSADVLREHYLHQLLMTAELILGVSLLQTLLRQNE